MIHGKPTICPMGLAENILLKRLLLLDGGIGVIIILVREKKG